MIRLKPDVWFKKIKPKLIVDFGQRILISYVCKRELGFTVREHRGWHENLNYKIELAQYQEKQRRLEENINFADFSALDYVLSTPPNKGHSVYEICLDFYDDAAESWFRLRYL